MRTCEKEDSHLSLILSLEKDACNYVIGSSEGVK